MTSGFARARALALIVPAALLGGAYIFEYGFGYWPCEMCWWQRYAHFAALVPALLAFIAADGAVRVWLVRLAGLGILASGLIGGFHAGVEYGWWEGFTQCTAMNLDTGQSALDAIMNAPTVRCDEVQWSLFGISMAGYNFLISTAAGLAVLALSAQTGRSRVGEA